MTAPVNATVAQLTVRTILGRRRALLLLALPVVLLVLSLIVRATVDADSREDVTIGLLGTFALATLIPLLGLIAGTGAIGPEIDDGSIVYLLAKPVPEEQCRRYLSGTPIHLTEERDPLVDAFEATGT